MIKELKDTPLHSRVFDLEIERIDQRAMIAKLDSRVRKLESGIKKAIGMLSNTPEISHHSSEEVMELDTCLTKVLAALESTGS